MEKIIDCDLCRYDNRLVKVTIEYKWDGRNFSASGNIGELVCGQCLDTIAELPELQDNDLVQRIVSVWREWHLNDMNAGTHAQKAELKRRLKVENLDRIPDYDVQCQWLKDAGLYEVPLTDNMEANGGFPEAVKNGERGYRYGERWLYHKVPDDIVEEIESWK